MPRLDGRFGRCSGWVRSGCPATIGGTIVGKNDFVVIVRRWRQRSPVRHPGAWNPVAVVDRRELAEAMAALLQEEGTDTEARAISCQELLHKIPTADRERILDRLNSRTTVEIKRELELRWASATRLAGLPGRRSGRERRSGRDRRSSREPNWSGEERRTKGDRRSGRDRRSMQPAA